MNFGEALDQLKFGARVYRAGWDGRTVWLAISDTQRWPASTMDPFIYTSTADGTQVPWVASQTDILATDWLIRISRDDAAENVTETKRSAATDLLVVEKFGLTLHDVDRIPVDIVRVMAERLSADGVRDGKRSINEHRRLVGLPPVAEGRPDDEGTAGSREPRTPDPIPVGPQATTNTASGGDVVVTFSIDGDQLYQAVEQSRYRAALRHVERQARG